MKKCASESTEEEIHIQPYSQSVNDVNQEIALLKHAKNISDCDAVISAIMQ